MIINRRIGSPGLMSAKLTDMSQKIWGKTKKKKHTEGKQMNFKLTIKQRRRVWTVRTEKIWLSMLKLWNYLETFYYLGNIISNKRGTDKDVQQRIKKAKNDSAQIRSVLR